MVPTQYQSVHCEIYARYLWIKLNKICHCLQSSAPPDRYFSLNKKNNNNNNDLKKTHTLKS